jgi:hypothetical protein
LVEPGTEPVAEPPDPPAELLRLARKALKEDVSPAIRELGDEVDDVLRRYLAESESD